MQLFQEKGVEGTKVEDITERADVSKGTFFNYFDSKHEVLAARFRRLSQECTAFIDADHGGEPLQRLMRFFERLDRRFRAEGDKLVRLYGEVLVRPELVAMDQAVEARVMAFYAGVLRDGQTTGSIRADLDVDLAARLIADVWASTLRSWMTSGAGFKLTDQLAAKLGLVFDGFTFRR